MVDDCTSDLLKDAQEDLLVGSGINEVPAFIKVGIKQFKAGLLVYRTKPKFLPFMLILIAPKARGETQRPEREQRL